jgi:hypothetical protein
MLFAPRMPLGLAVASLLLLAGLGRADEPESFKYLPTDSNLVIVLNVKQVRAWPPFKKEVRAKLAELLKNKDVQRVLKGTGFDPLRDLDRVVIVQAESSTVYYQDKHSAYANSNPSFFLLEGQFDEAKLVARAQKAVKDWPGELKVERLKRKGIHVLEITLLKTGRGNQPDNTLYAARLDKHTLMLSNIKQQADEAIAAAAGKKKAGPKSAQLRKLLAKADPKLAAQWFVTGDLISSVSTSGHAGPNGQQKFDIKTTTLRQQGVDQFHGGLTLGKDTLSMHTTVKAISKDKAELLAGRFKKGIEETERNLNKLVQRDKSFQPLLDAFKTARVTAKGDIISLQGHTTAEGVYQLVRSFFMLTESRPARVNEAPPRVVPQPPPPLNDKYLLPPKKR